MLLYGCVLHTCAFVASYIVPDYIAAVAHTTCSGLVMLLVVLVIDIVDMMISW